MKDVIKKVPIPLCGVMLGAAALGNLLQSYSEGIRYVCGIFAAFLLILVLLKLIMFPGAVKEDMGNPIMASVSGTFPMALMILSTYVKPFIGKAAYYIWLPKSHGSSSLHRFRLLQMPCGYHPAADTLFHPLLQGSQPHSEDFPDQLR